ncbi:uncharacterized protein N7459_003032 [Penicillium hispanicum]|uniref:uncharacterized protein n=1 Tax=Penicillium hispanicum TaxID=1080232 RepID=UPI00253FE8C8|nr:uncharacterized protein N7459_003032 [Penicillium hispanicum]KAJ5587267.1 hypothetical protein N7459_003032 [Penicillium hispanicum]
MDAQHLTALPSESHKPRSSLDDPASASSADARSHSLGSWSIKRLLSGRRRGRYRVLEREPNRLRKRVSSG